MLANYLPAEADEVPILTLHKSKGLEFDLVIHLDLHEWALSGKRPGPNNDFNNPKYDNDQQDINLHYVGITRARKGCVLLSSTKSVNNSGEIKNGKVSEFLSLNDNGKLRYGKKND